MAKTSDGGMFIPGTCNWMNPTDAPWYTRMDKFGLVMFQIYYTNINMFHTYSTMQTSDGGFILAGEQLNVGVIEKLDPLGNVMWSYSYQNVTMFTSIVQTSDGGYAALGASLIGANGSLALFKLDPNGIIMWTLFYDGPNVDQPGQVRETVNAAGIDGYIIIGTTNSFGPFNDILVIKTDPIGNIMWQITHGEPTTNDGGLTVEQTADFGYIIGGYTNMPMATNQEMLLLKIDMNGMPMWNFMYPAAYNEKIYDIDITSDGGHIFAGGIGIAGTPGHYLVKTDPVGNIMWQRDYIAHDIQQVYQDAAGNYLAAGTFDTASSFAYDIFGMRTDFKGEIGICPFILPGNLTFSPQNIIPGLAQFMVLPIPSAQAPLAPMWNPAMGTMTMLCSATDPGAVPDNDNYPGTALTIAKSGLDSLVLAWSAPGGACETEDYAIYRGILPWSGYNHTPIVCSTGSQTTATISADSNSYFYLLTALYDDKEGSTGLDSSDIQRPAGITPCYEQLIGTCDPPAVYSK
ncbi:MAG: hypothetical protein A2Y62_04870 [Candidatus Fischerbacteria bacterium RBG_13_37_8]|uniref:Fibronectin type-III domain-containing protein n=1 Tax=Candidatus Fischerbacteria bacterium RBG_13_37_8 TaxID=1817863 RepID=A0A1F5VHM3_9BACT|nr:MAG: hypothetical protein A2Y62_04870 [Candidatus Fischerbacteria bacterium RBG_13_37_8]